MRFPTGHRVKESVLFKSRNRKRSFLAVSLITVRAETKLLGDCWPAIATTRLRRRFMAPGGRLAKEFHIMPQTFVLPHEFTTFVAAFTSSGKCLCYAWAGCCDVALQSLH